MNGYAVDLCGLCELFNLSFKSLSLAYVEERPVRPAHHRSRV